LTEFAQGPTLNVAVRLDCPRQIRSVSLHLNDRIIDHPNNMIRDTYSFMHLIARFERDLPAGFLGGVKGFHTQQLETAKGIDLFQRAAGPASCTGSLLRRCQELGLQWRLKAALAPRGYRPTTELLHSLTDLY
jgi:hypothetical protein